MSKGIVLISGINGYMAAVSARYYLEAGFSVRGTVRRAASAEALQEALASYSDRLEIVEVADITTPGAFDKAVEGVTAIAHIASPVSLSFTDPDPVMHAAVNGTLSILKSAKDFAGPQLTSFVVISSVAAIRSADKASPYTFTEKDWNTTSEDVVQRLGKDAPGPEIYRASKVAAERAMWEFGKTEKLQFSLTALNPGFVMGPPLAPFASASQIHESTIAIYTILSGGKIPEFSAGIYVDVRDVARLLVWSVENHDTANGERYLVAGGAYNNQAIADILRKAYPDRQIEAGKPGEGYAADFEFKPGSDGFDLSKAVKATGQGWIPFADTVLDSAKSFEGLL